MTELERIIAERVAAAVRGPAGAPRLSRCVLVGPPDSILDKVYNSLTDAGAHDWASGEGSDANVPVILVASDRTAQEPGVKSAIGGWDYALSMRDSSPVFIVLASRAEWDMMPESISNAAVVLGEPMGTDFAREPWQAIIRAIAAEAGVSRPAVRETLAALANERRAPRIPSPDPHWDFAEGVMSGESFPFGAGLPFVPVGGTPAEYGLAMTAGAEALAEIVARVSEEGLAGAATYLAEAAAAYEPASDRPAVAAALADMLAHIATTAGSGLGFAKAPRSYFRPPSAGAGWWQVLRPNVLVKVASKGNRRPSGQLRVQVADAVATSGTTVVVRGAATIRASIVTGGIAAAPSGGQLVRGRGASMVTIPLTADPGGTTSSGTEAPPSHDKPTSYRVVVGASSASAKVVALDSFEAGGLLFLPGSSVALPAKGKDGVYVHDLAIPQSGERNLKLLATSSAASCSVGRVGEPASTYAVIGGTAEFSIPLSHQDEIVVELRDASGVRVGGWLARALVEDGSAKSPSSEWQRLIRANSEKSEPPAARAPYLQIRELEARLLTHDGLGRGALAWWTKAIGADPGDFDANDRIGDLPIPDQYDPRPTTATAPEAYIDARSAVFDLLRKRGRPLPELFLAASDLLGPIEAYARTYLDWVSGDRSGLWAETISLFVATSEGDPPTISSQPVAVLLPPTHPLKLAWLANAQRVLREAVDSGKKCPIATALDPGVTPGSLALDLRTGDTVQRRVFLAARSGDPYWGLLINGRDVENRADLPSLYRALAWLRLAPENVAGGLSAEQTIRALGELESMTPTRAVVRLGLVSAGDGRGRVGGATLDWASARLASQDEDGEPKAPTSALRSVQIFDFRASAANPAPSAIASAGEQTGERLVWFRPETPPAGLRPDLTLMEDIELINYEVEDGPARSAIGRGGLVRLDIREDSGNAQWVSESRSARRPSPEGGTSLADVLEALVGVIEAPVADGAAPRLKFEPKQQLLQGWVERSSFVAASSNQLDPACFVRGAHSGLLWDFDIPANSPDATGYYLIAGRHDGVGEAVRRGLDLSDGVPIGPILDEVSRRGIPILRRIAAGGSQARGEMGMLLGSRLLQDAFRDTKGEVVLPVATDQRVIMLLPVDPYRAVFEAARKGLLDSATDKRADLLVIAVDRHAGGIRIELQPVEVKNRPGLMPLELLDALTQAHNLEQLATTLWVAPPQNELWDQASRAFLARCVDHAFRLYADPGVHGLTPPAWLRLHQEAIDAILGSAKLADVVRVGGARLIASHATGPSVTRDLDGDGQKDTILVGPEDWALLLSDVGVSPSLRDLVGPLFLSGPPAAGFGDAPADGSGPPGPGGAAAEGRAGEPDNGEARSTAGTESQAEGAGQADRGPEHASEPAGGQTEQAREPSDAVEAARPLEPLSGKAAEANGAPSDRVIESAGDRVAADAVARVSPAARARVKDALAGFIGNEEAVAQVTRGLLAATLTEPARLPRNYLFVGHPSVGKTELARRIARGLGLPFLRLDGPTLVSRERLFGLIDEQLAESGQEAVDEGTDAGARVLRYPPFVVFVDEVHLVARAAQESLLTLLEPRDRRARIGDKVVHVPDATFLFATTRPQKIDKALRSRCLRIDLQPYDADQIAQMVEERVAQEHGDVGWDDEVYLRLAYLSRLVPRAAFELAEDLWTEEAVSEFDRSPVDHLKAVQRGRNIDDRGLRPRDFQSLAILDRATGPVGEESLATQLGIDRDELVDDVEPMLIRMNLVARGLRGREITPEGRAYLAEHRVNAED